ncbi:MAG: peptidoglycan-binding domain-containing protein [Leifsonia sp.]
MKRLIPRWSASLAILIVLAALAVGALVGALLVPAPVPSAIAPRVRADTVKATQVSTADEQDVTLTLTIASERALTVPVSGVVTTTTCRSGGSVSSGTSGFSVNDVPLVYFASDRPLWRDLTVGDVGEDVRSVQRELARLGYPVQVDGRFGPSTLRALSGVVTAAGVDDASRWTGLPLSRFIWLPAETARTLSCDVQVGAQVAVGDRIATLPRGIAEARVSPLPERLVAGERVAVVGDLALPVDESGTVAGGEPLALLAASNAFQDYSQKSGGRVTREPAASDGGADPGVPAVLRLTKPIAVFSVPAAAVYSVSDTSGCVLDAAGPMPVTIVASRLGRSLVQPDGGRKLGSVSLATTKAPSCR